MSNMSNHSRGIARRIIPNTIAAQVISLPVSVLGDTSPSVEKKDNVYTAVHICHVVIGAHIPRSSW